MLGGALMSVVNFTSFISIEMGELVVEVDIKDGWAVLVNFKFNMSKQC